MQALYQHHVHAHAPPFLRGAPDSSKELGEGPPKSSATPSWLPPEGPTGLLSGALLVTLMAWVLHQARVLPPAFLHGHQVRRISAFGVVYFDTMDVCQNVLGWDPKSKHIR
jgi:hypothetical protein